MTGIGDGNISIQSRNACRQHCGIAYLQMTVRNRCNVFVVCRDEVGQRMRAEDDTAFLHLICIAANIGNAIREQIAANGKMSPMIKHVAEIDTADLGTTGKRNHFVMCQIRAAKHNIGCRSMRILFCIIAVIYRMRKPLCLLHIADFGEQIFCTFRIQQCRRCTNHGSIGIRYRLDDKTVGAVNLTGHINGRHLQGNPISADHSGSVSAVQRDTAFIFSKRNRSAFNDFRHQRLDANDGTVLIPACTEDFACICSIGFVRTEHKTVSTVRNGNKRQLHISVRFRDLDTAYSTGILYVSLRTVYHRGQRAVGGLIMY